MVISCPQLLPPAPHPHPPCDTTLPPASPKPTAPRYRKYRKCGRKREKLMLFLKGQKTFFRRDKICQVLFQLMWSYCQLTSRLSKYTKILLLTVIWQNVIELGECNLYPTVTVKLNNFLDYHSALVSFKLILPDASLSV